MERGRKRKIEDGRETEIWPKVFGQPFPQEKQAKEGVQSRKRE